MKTFAHFILGVLKKLSNNFIKGLIFIMPLAITVYAIYLIFRFFQNLLPSEHALITVPAVIAAITIFGFVATKFIQNPISQWFTKSIERIPLIKIIYTSVRDLLSAFMGNEKRFNKPVMVRMGNESGIYKLGFITQTNLDYLNISEGHSAVYMPHSYNFSGNLFIVENKLIKPLDLASDDFIKHIVSGGITRI